MKSKLDHLLACAGEECGEVQQVVGKALRFGIWSGPSGTGILPPTDWMPLPSPPEDK